jgi:hypothetical protein
MASSIQVHFGSQSIAWVEFIKLVNWYRMNHRKANVGNILKLDALRQSMYLDRNTFSLTHLLTDFYDSFCSVKLDKVFAFVGMANECRDGCIDVNYNKSPYSVYEDLITFQSLSSEEPLERRIGMPYFASVARQNLERKSSSIKKKSEYFGKLADPNSYIYDACGDERAIICSTDSSGNITSNAKVFDLGLRLAFFVHILAESSVRGYLAANKARVSCHLASRLQFRLNHQSDTSSRIHHRCHRLHWAFVYRFSC